MDDEQIHGQMTVQEYIDWLERLEEFEKYMNKTEKGEQRWRNHIKARKNG